MYTWFLCLDKNHVLCSTKLHYPVSSTLEVHEPELFTIHEIKKLDEMLSKDAAIITSQLKTTPFNFKAALLRIWGNKIKKRLKSWKIKQKSKTKS